MKKKVLIFAKHYIPCVKAGGPTRSLENIVEKLHLPKRLQDQWR